MRSADEILAMFSVPSKVRPIEVGTRFGLLVVLGMGDPACRANGRLVATSLARCECGSERAYRNNGLRQGYWKSCGCKQIEHAAAGNVRHGHSIGGKRSPELTAHRMMLRRCYDAKSADYPDYGERGIQVCQRWRDSFLSFLEDMGRKPSRLHSIERDDVNGNYDPGNCHWAHPLEQANNKRNTFWVEYGGRRISLAEFARETGIRAHTLRLRLLLGMTAEEAIISAKTRAAGRKIEVVHA